MVYIMHRTQILLEDEQYERLKLRSATSGQPIGELVRQAVDKAYGEPTVDDRLRALQESHGAVDDEDFDGLNGAEYVDQSRRGFDHRLTDLGADDRR